jgi:two-component system, LytTR family, response regulator
MGAGDRDDAAPVAGAAVILLLVTLGYTLVFAATERFDALTFAHWSLANAIPPVALGYAVSEGFVPRLITVPAIARTVTIARAVAIVALAIAFSLLSYVGTIVLLGIGRGWGEAGFFVRFFSGPALPWQMLQGSAYAAIALLIGWVRHSQRLLRAALAQRDAALAATALGDANSQPRETHLLVRSETGMQSIDAAAIIRIMGADDYCEVVTMTARHLARISLNDCAARLTGQPFTRVHRSHIVNLAQMATAESAGGGRMLLTMSNGDTLTTSRTGARALRSRVV